MNCSTPIDAAVLADYWVADLTKAEEEAVEQHLFTCDDCGARLREIAALAEGIRGIAQDGTLFMVVSDEFLKRAAEQGVRIREYCPPNGGSIQCTVTAEDDLLIGRLISDLRGAKRIDLCICDPGGVERFRLPDIPFDPSAGSIAFQNSITYAKAAPSETIVARLVSMDDAGGERLLGEYTFHHTRSLPGAGGRI
jgi:hypothetical protein